MAVYLYNLIFSLTGSDYAVGRFQPYNSTIVNPTILNQSAAWFTYQPGAGTPNNLGDYYSPVTQALVVGQWGNPQVDTGQFALTPGDYLMMRVATADGNSANYRVRYTAIFARGTGAPLAAGAGDLQSPLVMSTATVVSALPRAVIDTDAVLGNSNPATWPTPIASDGSCVNWLGMVHAAPNASDNDYTLNVGASVFVTSGAPAVGNLFTFGHDPRMRVGGMKKKVAA
jgi:hypothetical protein